MNPFNLYIVATCNEIQSFLLFLIQPSSGMVFSPCFSEVIPVTVVTSFPRRLVITVVIGKLVSNASRAPEAERAPEVKQVLQREGSRSGHKRQDASRQNSRGFFPATGRCRLLFLTGEPCVSASLVTLT